MIGRKLIFLSAVFISPCSFGKLTITSLGEVFHEVPLIQESQTEIEGSAIPLVPFGHALTSKVLDICVVQLLVSDPNQFERADLLQLDPQEAIAIQMTFLIPLNGNSIYSVIRKALKKNGVDIHREDIKAYLEVVKVSVRAGDSLVFLGKKLSDERELVEVKIPNSGRLFRISGEGVVRDVFSAWLENVSYADYLERAQQQLLERLNPI